MTHESPMTPFAARVERFNREVIGLPIPETPTLPSRKRFVWAINAFEEEMDEIAKAFDASDVTGFVDGCLDLAYFALGRVIECGFPVGAGFETVDDANGCKVRGQLSKRPGSMGYDAVKPEGWTPPETLLAAMLSLSTADLSKAGDLKTFHPRVWAEEPSTIGFRAHEWLRHREAMDFMRRYRSISADALEAALRHQQCDGVPPAAVVAAVEPRAVVAGHLERRKKILVLGHARHGKDTAAEYLARAYGLRFQSSSAFCAERVVMPRVEALWRAYESDPIANETRKPVMDEYSSVWECFEDRVNHRALWREWIEDYNAADPARLGCQILEDNDVYVGARTSRELMALRNGGHYDLAVWIDASGRGVPPEPRDSCTVEPWMADYVVDNSRGVPELEVELSRLFDRLML